MQEGKISRRGCRSAGGFRAAGAWGTLVSLAALLSSGAAAAAGSVAHGLTNAGATSGQPVAAAPSDHEAHGPTGSSSAQGSTPVCEAHIQGQPGKRFDLADIRVPARCEQFTVHLLHTGKKPWQEAGHNWVLARTADIDAVIADGERVGPDHAWLQRGDSRVIAATQMLSGGEHASVSFPVSRLRAGESYTYYCSFPTHAVVMRGRLTLNED